MFAQSKIAGLEDPGVVRAMELERKHAQYLQQRAENVSSQIPVLVNQNLGIKLAASGNDGTMRNRYRPRYQRGRLFQKPIKILNNPKHVVANSRSASADGFYVNRQRGLKQVQPSKQPLVTNPIYMRENHIDTMARKMKNTHIGNRGHVVQPAIKNRPPTNLETMMSRPKLKDMEKYLHHTPKFERVKDQFHVARTLQPRQRHAQRNSLIGLHVNKRRTKKDHGHVRQFLNTPIKLEPVLAREVRIASRAQYSRNVCPPSNMLTKKKVTVHAGTRTEYNGGRKYKRTMYNRIKNFHTKKMIIPQNSVRALDVRMRGAGRAGGYNERSLVSSVSIHDSHVVQPPMITRSQPYTQDRFGNADTALNINKRVFAPTPVTKHHEAFETMSRRPTYTIRDKAQPLHGPSYNMGARAPRLVY
jgi:hypothetical protein